jgi:hypothetical protein
MTLSIRHVDVNYMQQTWPLVKPFIDEAMEKAADYLKICYPEIYEIRLALIKS